MKVPPKPSFFLPAIEDEKEAERLYQQIRKTISGLTERRICSIQFHHDKHVTNATVGEAYCGELVIAIFEGHDSYHIFTLSEVGPSAPSRIGNDEVIQIEDFAKATKSSRASARTHRSYRRAKGHRG